MRSAALLLAAATTLTTTASPPSRITTARLRAHIRYLSSDLLEGRGPATRGDSLAQAYIAAQMEEAGLLPGAPDETFFQPFDIVGISSRAPERFSVGGSDGKTELKLREDFMAVSGVQSEEARVDDAELVF